jgi:hypothetical protein
VKFSGVSRFFLDYKRDFSVYKRKIFLISLERTFVLVFGDVNLTDLVRSSQVYEMYYFEMPGGAEGIEYYSSFL